MNYSGEKRKKKIEDFITNKELYVLSFEEIILNICDLITPEFIGNFHYFSILLLG
jgi:hypothetical protein